MKQKKKLFASLFLACMLLINAIPVLANSEIAVFINETKLEFDVPPQIINDRTMVPMRKIFESLGAVVTWDEPSRTATGKKDGVTVNVSIDSKTLFKNGEPKTLDVAPALIDGRTLVPVRAIAESFDCKVDWIAETRTVQIVTDENGTITKTALSASEISEKVSPSVFYIEVYDDLGFATGSGSGFFLSANGVAVTNYHVIEKTSGAIITTTSGDRFEVTDIIAFDETLDVAIIRVSKTSLKGKAVSGFPNVQTADSDNIKAGQTVYALGSPQGFQNTISNGIISNPHQTIQSGTFIQITAPISPGSSGGALVNEYGEVLGITSVIWVEEYSQNINFAIPINIINLFDLNAEGVSYSDFAQNESRFILEVSPDVVEIGVGDVAEILVHAEGKGDWSIYWDTEDETIIGCEWGDWFEDDPNVCSLYVEGLKAGTATITVYSDVDFKGVDITVRVTKNTASVSTYPGTNIPTYTSVTGVKLLDIIDNGDGLCLYIYKIHDSEEVLTYGLYLEKLGFYYLGEEDLEGSPSFLYRAPDGSELAIIVALHLGEVGIFVEETQ